VFVEPTLAGLAALVAQPRITVPPNLLVEGCTAITPDLLPLIDLSQREIDRIVATVPGGAENVQDIYPLTPLQEGILFHHLMEQASDAYLLQTLLAFDSRNRLDSFLTTLAAVISRHDILRTGVVWEGLSQPVQVVWRQAPLPVEEITLDPTDGDVAEQLQARFDPRRFRFDVRQAPLLRAFITHDVAQDRWLLQLLNHHLALDHITLEVLVEEVRAYWLGQADRLAPVVPFRNFVAQLDGRTHARSHDENRP
jgi:hypothetical protein